MSLVLALGTMTSHEVNALAPHPPPTLQLFLPPPPPFLLLLLLLLLASRSAFRPFAFDATAALSVAPSHLGGPTSARLPFVVVTPTSKLSIVSKIPS